MANKVHRCEGSIATPDGYTMVSCFSFKDTPNELMVELINNYHPVEDPVYKGVDKCPFCLYESPVKMKKLENPQPLKMPLLMYNHLSKEEILNMHPRYFSKRLMVAAEVVHILKTMGYFWVYDYKAAKEGRFGRHAILKSKEHSDGFANVKGALKEYPVLLEMFSQQMALFIRSKGFLEGITHLAGIPDGASTLGERIAEIVGLPILNLSKNSAGEILVDAGQSNLEGQVLLIDDVSTEGTALIDSVRSIAPKLPWMKIASKRVVALNRGGIKSVVVEKYGEFKIEALASYLMNEWPGDKLHCKLCQMGSIPMKPKVNEGDWEKLTHSQDPVAA